MKNSAYEPRIRRSIPQGSWAHKTIIKPPGDKDFDADLLVIVDEEEGWEPTQYVDELHTIFLDNGTYQGMTSRGTRCISLDYAGDFHLDVVPVIQGSGQNGQWYFVCNRKENELEETAPEDYTDWLVERNRITGANQLRKTIRLLKYLRDVKGTFSAKSILLTTLVGMQISDSDQWLQRILFSDVPTSLKTIIGRLDDFLQDRPLMPEIKNPVLISENFNRHWDSRKYKNFRDKIHLYRGWIDNAYEEPDNDEGIAKWRGVFGDEFAKGVVLKEGTRALAPLDNFSNQWLAELRNRGPQILYEFPTGQHHVVRARWPMDNKLTITVEAKKSAYEFGPVVYKLNSGDFVPRGCEIEFTVRSRTGILDLSSYEVWWRVVNSGGHAAREGGLRGDFYPSTNLGTRKESTKYRGIHWVEAFVVSRRAKQCVGKSRPFFVAIE